MQETVLFDRLYTQWYTRYLYDEVENIKCLSFPRPNITLCYQYYTVTHVGSYWLVCGHYTTYRIAVYGFWKEFFFSHDIYPRFPPDDSTYVGVLSDIFSLSLYFLSLSSNVTTANRQPVKFLLPHYRLVSICTFITQVSFYSNAIFYHKIVKILFFFK